MCMLVIEGFDHPLPLYTHCHNCQVDAALGVEEMVERLMDRNMEESERRG